MESDYEHKVKATLFVFAYNQQQFVEASCYAALAQTYSPLEIIFSDDCSSDATFEIMKKIAAEYTGPHNVTLNMNERNLGLAGHVNKAFEISSGELIIAAAGDDISLPERVSRTVDAYEESGRTALILHSSVIKINAVGEELGTWVPPIVTGKLTLEQIAVSLGLYIGATGAWSKKLYERFGPIYYHGVYEDLALGFRAALQDALFYIEEPLVRYRIGFGLTSSSQVHGNMSSRARARIKELQVAEAVFAQRLRDLYFVDTQLVDAQLREKLQGSLEIRLLAVKKKLMFYHNPFSLALQLLSTNCLLVLKAFYTEIRSSFGA